ncbi:MAG: A/G-specific adenine glycosylase [Alphaproteobacteria bacterium]|jgi:A/G-specific adenine glycosylase|tara:strand:+ start:8009 stop:9076 length:1068 start_codon:yes stop_codon:yes gene_type:complete
MNKLNSIKYPLLSWYDLNKRDLPWRLSVDGQYLDPYKVLVSEVMLQQTTVSAAIKYFKNFIEKWPNIELLASASEDEIINAWAGLGYYARARNLLKCAKIIANDFQGNFPQDINLLKKLPGIGDYTSAAIMSIAFNKQSDAVDVNIERVISRLFALQSSNLSYNKKMVRDIVFQLTSGNRPGDVLQSLMDVGSLICSAKNCTCTICPLEKKCMSLKQDIISQIPIKGKKVSRGEKIGTLYLITRRDGAYLLRKRPSKGLLGGTVEFPGTNWEDTAMIVNKNKYLKSNNLHYSELGVIKHTFSHFYLTLSIVGKIIFESEKDFMSPFSLDKCFWVLPEEFHKYGFSSLMKKAMQYI